MELSDFSGVYSLDGVDFDSTQIEDYYSRFKDAEVCRFRLNGVIYAVVEDPEDGYRSSLRELVVDDSADMKNVFSPVEVIANHVTDRPGYFSGRSCDILELTDSKTGEIVLEVGTDDTDDYYPYFVASFYPEAMVINK
jgi:hypothetical protein